jgi:hypothetical protein
MKKYMSWKRVKVKMINGISVNVQAIAKADGRLYDKRLCRDTIRRPMKDAVVSDILFIAKKSIGKNIAPGRGKMDVLS